VVMIRGAETHRLATHTAAKAAGGPRLRRTPMRDAYNPTRRCPAPGPNSHGTSCVCTLHLQFTHSLQTFEMGHACVAQHC
jgi:hypothetical protein